MIADQRKKVQHLGTTWKYVPIEVLPMAYAPLQKKIKVQLRSGYRIHSKFRLFNVWYLIFFLIFFVCFSNPTSPPWSPIGLVPCLVQCVSAYTLSSPALKGVTRNKTFTYDFFKLDRVDVDNVSKKGENMILFVN